MGINHSTADDMPSPSAREHAQALIDKAMAEYLAAGGKTSNANSCTLVTQDSISDQDLVKKLVEQSAGGKTVQVAAKVLRVSEQRCRSLAIEHRIPFRTKAFLKKRALK